MIGRWKWRAEAPIVHLTLHPNNPVYSSPPTLQCFPFLGPLLMSCFLSIMSFLLSPSPAQILPAFPNPDPMLHFSQSFSWCSLHLLLIGINQFLYSHTALSFRTLNTSLCTQLNFWTVNPMKAGIPSVSFATVGLASSTV